MMFCAHTVTLDNPVSRHDHACFIVIVQFIAPDPLTISCNTQSRKLNRPHFADDNIHAIVCFNFYPFINIY